MFADCTVRAFGCWLSIVCCPVLAVNFQLSVKDCYLFVDFCCKLNDGCCLSVDECRMLLSFFVVSC